MQTLTIAYNIGHFANTFVASKAIIMLANSEPAFCEHIVNAAKDERYREAAYVVLNSHNYQRVHLLNTLLALEKCDQSNRSVQITKELILAYLMENKLSGDSKLHEYFKTFRRIRTVSFVTYDLQIADVPFTVDLWNNKGLLYLLREYLAEFNNNDSAVSIITEIAQMLDSSVYNKLESVICSTQISKQIIRKMCTGDTWNPYYQNYWLDFNSSLNKTYPQVHDYRAPYLKLTFRKENLQKAENLYRELDKQNNIRAGYYLRHSGEMTIVISVFKNTGDKAKVSFRVLKTVTKYTRQMGLSVDDGIYILATKFFLYYLFHERHLTIKPILDDKRCVICTKGKNTRILELGKLLDADGSADEKHEIEAARNNHYFIGLNRGRANVQYTLTNIKENLHDKQSTRYKITSSQRINMAFHGTLLCTRRHLCSVYYSSAPTRPGGLWNSRHCNCVYSYPECIH